MRKDFFSNMAAKVNLKLPKFSNEIDNYLVEAARMRTPYIGVQLACEGKKKSSQKERKLRTVKTCNMRET